MSISLFKLSFEKLKNLLLSTQSHVAQRERENLHPEKNAAKSPQYLSSSHNKPSASQYSTLPKTDNKNRLLKSLASAKDAQIAFGDAINQTIADRSQQLPSYLPPQHHSTPVKLQTHRSARSLPQDHPPLPKSGLNKKVSSRMIYGDIDEKELIDDTRHSSECPGDAPIEPPSSKAEEKVVVESTKALEMAFQHFNHLQSLFQEMSIKMTTEKQGSGEEEGTDIVSTIV